MSFSDILALLEILVTILFGYYITHWVTVRDTRTRSVKDLYLSQLSDIKKKVDHLFDSWFESLTETQLMYYKAYSEGKKSPFN